MPSKQRGITTTINIIMLSCDMELYENIKDWFISFPIGWQMILVFAPLFLVKKWRKTFKKHHK